MTAMHKPSATAIVLTSVLLTTALICPAASVRKTLQKENFSSDSSTERTDEENKRAATLSSEVLQDANEGVLSLRHPAHDMDGPLIIFPQFMDRVLSTAFSSVDRMSSGLLSGLAGPNVEYARTQDGKRLIVRLHLPPVPNKGKSTASPKMSVAVVGQSHLRVKLDMRSDGFQSFSEHTYGLPAHVSSDGITMTPQEDGTVHVSLRILKETNELPASGESGNDSSGDTGNSFFERRLKNPLFPLVLQRNNEEIASKDEIVEELPTREEVDHCRANYPSNKMLRKKCTCDATPSKAAKAVCYGSLISKAVSVSRRLGMDDFATSAKHHAIECADGHIDTVRCLQKVASELLLSLYQGDNVDKSALEDRVRAAIESEDDGPSNFEPSYRTMLSLFIIFILVVMFVCGTLLYSIKRFRGSSRSYGILTELSSVLAQRGRPPGALDEVSSEGPSSRLGPFQSTSRSSKVRTTRKSAGKSGSGDSKIA